MTLFCGISFEEGQDVLGHILDDARRELRILHVRNVFSLHQLITLKYDRKATIILGTKTLQ